MKRIKHTRDSLKLLGFLQRYAGKWHTISGDQKTQRALGRLQELLGTDIIQFDGFTFQMRFNAEGYHDDTI